MVEEKTGVRNSNGLKPRSLRSRKFFLSSLILIIVVVEFLLMQAHHIYRFLLPPELVSVWWLDVFLDSILTLTILTPFLYFFFFSAFLKNISEYKDLVEAIEQGGKKYRIMVETSNDLIWLLDKEGRFEYINPKAEDISGYELKEWIGKSFVSMIPAVDAQKVADLFRETLAGKKIKYETSVYKQDGSIVILSVNTVPLYLDDKVVGTISFGQDITERKKNEEFLIKAKNDWEEMFNSVTDVITIHDCDFNVLRVNKAAESFLGKQMQEIVSKKCYQVFHNRQSQVEGCPGAMALQTGKPQVCELFDPESGIYLEASAYPRFDERKNTIGIIHLVKNISQRKDAERKLMMSELKYRTLTAISPMGIFRTDMKGDYLYVNLAWCGITGLRISEALGRGWYNSIHPDERLLVSEEWQAHVREKRLFTREYRLQKPDKTIVYVKTQTVLEINEEGEVVGYLGTLTDVSEFKILEMQLRSSFDRLKDAQTQLVQSTKIATLGQLAGGIAHELNNPLTGVLNNVQLIKMEMELKKDYSCQDFKELLDIVESSALRCKKIIRSFLDLAHVSKGELQAICLNALVEKVAVIISTEMQLVNINLNKELQADLGNIQGDLQLLEEVILVLVSNAKWAIEKRFQGEQGGNLTIKTCQDQEAKNIFLVISDNGVGIPQENISKLFNPFFTTKKVGEGTGLGLALIQDILKKHNAEITVESQVNVCTTFKIKFPCFKDESER